MEPLTPQATRAVERATDLAARAGAPRLGWAHLLLAVLQSRGTAAEAMLRGLSVDGERLGRDLASLEERGHSSESVMSAWAMTACERAEDCLTATGRSQVGTGELLQGLLAACPAEAEPALAGAGLPRASLLEGPPVADPRPREFSVPVPPFVAVIGAALAWTFYPVLELERTSVPAWAWAAVFAVLGWVLGTHLPKAGAPAPGPGKGCSVCGFPSPRANLFREGVCLRCSDEVEARHHRSHMALYAGLLLVGLAFVGLTGDGWWLVNLGLLYPLMVLLVAPHELGHALAARLLGVETAAVLLGVGPRVGSFRLLGAPWSVHRNLYRGLTVLLPAPGERVRPFLILLAGPAVNLLAAAIAVPFVASWDHESLFTGFAPATVWVLANLFLLLGSLNPASAAGGFPSDGMQMLQLLRGPRFTPEALPVLTIGTAVHHLATAGLRDEALGLLERGLAAHPESPSLHAWRNALLLRAERWEEAVEGLLRELELPEPASGQRAMSLNNLAWARLHQGRLDEALALSEEALALDPDSPWYLGTRGCALARAGRADEACEHLERALRLHTDRRALAADFAHLALAEETRGRAEEAEVALRTARHLDPEVEVPT